ncbi:MAG TPA: 6-pyruvoyl-tetrahydropterin synthase-related protein [Bryobacteraceae bacterium]|nr:6-pyruvoyl-tetrahydropterin synthase-related protein [Bryobacteraceae bacterium]
MLVLLSAAFAVIPEMLRGPSCGHDFDFHLVSWIDALHSWRQGILYPHWTPTPNFTAGEPRFVFYPPLTWMLGAFLGALIPWRFLPQVIVFLLLAATGMATRALARQVFNEGVATLAGCAAIFSGYALFTAYERSAFAEMTGGFWVPVMLMLVLRDFRPGASPIPEAGAPGPGPPQTGLRLWGTSLASEAGERARAWFDVSFDRTALQLALVIAGAWLSNAPLGVMLSYLLAGVTLVAALLARSWIPVLRAAVAAVLGLGLAAFFWIPAAWEQRWVEIRQAVDDPGLLIENSWLFARHHDPRLELHDIELIRVSAIAVTMVLVALAGVGMSWWRRTLPPERRWWIPIAIIPVAVICLQFPASDFIWNALPKMRFLQFPWRWLVVVEAPMAIFFASAVWPGKRAWRVVVAAVCCAAFATATAFAFVSLFQGCDEEDQVNGVLRDYSSGDGVAGTDEYAPPGADDSLVPTGLPFACLVTDPTDTLGKGDPDMTPEWNPDQGSCEATFAESGRTSEHHRLTANLPHAGYLVLRLRSYPAWRLSLNGRAVGSMPSRQDGLMAVPVPRGPVELTADWTTTPDVLVGRVVSSVALALITLLWLLERRRIRARLS